MAKKQLQLVYWLLSNDTGRKQGNCGRGIAQGNVWRGGHANSVLGMLGEQIWIVRLAQVNQSAAAKTTKALVMSASLSAFLVEFFPIFWPSDLELSIASLSLRLSF